MKQILFIANDHTMVWLPASPEGTGQKPAERLTPGALLEMVRCGAWQLPEEMRVRFIMPKTVELLVRLHGHTVVVRPTRPLRERFPGRQPDLTPQQREVLRLMAAGQTAGQIALATFHSERWVHYQIAQIRICLGVTSRAAVLRRRRKES
jgi:DNA-binding NarL/FixJ family response regulator